MTLSEDAVQRAAELLYAAQQTRVPIAPLTQSFPDMSVDDAYAIQQANLVRRTSEGRNLVGHKIGLTSEPMQKLLGVSEPDFGYILDDMVLAAGEVAERGRFCAPRVEPEVAFRLHTPLQGPGVTVADVYAATDAVAAALEIVDSRIADWKLTLPDTVADNASSGAVALGQWVDVSSREPNLHALRAVLSLNGTQIDSGLGSAVLGDPAAAVAWLANAVGAYGTTIEPGQIVMSGSFTTAAFVESGDSAAATIDGLGSVSVTFR